jgi:hypothetical protein
LCPPIRTPYGSARHIPYGVSDERRVFPTMAKIEPSARADKES